MKGSYNCETCQHKHCDSSNPAGYVKWGIPDIIESKTCLLPMVTNASSTYIKLYGHYKNSILPFKGGLLDQPNPFIEAMSVIDERLAENARIRNTRKNNG